MYGAALEYVSSEPRWWNLDVKKCDCNEGYELIDFAVGYSDSMYRQWKCNKCGRVFCDWLEG